MPRPSSDLPKFSYESEADAPPLPFIAFVWIYTGTLKVRMQPYSNASIIDVTASR